MVPWKARLTEKGFAMKLKVSRDGYYFSIKISKIYASKKYEYGMQSR